MKKIISFLLTICLLLGILPMQAGLTAFAADDENLALDKPVTALDSRPTSNPQSITDGNITSYWAGSAGVDGNWIMVDLEQEYIITQVVLHLPLDAGREANPYRRYLTVEFSNTPDFAVKESVVALGAVESEVGVPVPVSPTSKTPYRYVRVVKMINTTHILNELEVYGYSKPEGLIIGPDVVGTKLEGPVTLLSYLEMVKPEDDINGTFGVDTVLTRGEAARMVVDAFAGNVSFSGGIPFNDVGKTHQNYMDVMTACHLGYVTGDNNSLFRPNEYVTQTEFLFMTLRAMGYGDVLQKVYQNHPGKAISLAEELRLFKNVSVSDVNGPVTRGDAVMFFYNAFLAPDFTLQATESAYLVLNEEENMLKRQHNLVLTQGVVKENRVSTLDGSAKTSANAAKIGNKSFVDTEGVLDNYLGQTMVVVTSTDRPDNVLIAWPALTNEEVVLQSKQLVSTVEDIRSGRVVALDENDKNETYHLEDKFYVVKNGLAHPYYKPEDLMLTNGSLRLLDNDRDGVYEVVFIDAFTLHYVKSAYYDDYELTFVDAEGERKTLQREHLTLQRADGESVGVKKVAKDVVVQLFDGGEYSKLVVFNEPHTGMLSALSSESIMVGNTTYPLSMVYKNTTPTYSPVVGEMVCVFVDAQGEVLWIEPDEDANNKEWVIAFSQRTAITTGLKPEVGFKLFVEDGSWKTLYVADKVTVDGVSMEKSALASLIKSGSKGRFTAELLRYKVNKNGLISVLDTVSDAKNFNYSQTLASGLYAPDTEAFWSGSKMEMYLPARKDTKTFIIPTLGNDYAVDPAYDHLYNVVTLRSVTPAQSLGGVEQNLRVYMPDESGYPTCFLKTQSTTAISDSSQQLTAVTSTNAPFMLVESVVQTLNSAGEVSVKVTGRSITSSGIGSQTSFLADPNLKMIETGRLYQEDKSYLKTPGSGSHNYVENDMVDVNKLSSLPEKYTSLISTIGFGDIVRYQSATPNVNAVERVFDYDEKTPPVFGSAGSSTWYAVNGHTGVITGYNRYQLGTLQKVSDTSFTIVTQAKKTDSDEYLKETYPKTAFGTVLVCKNNKGKTTVERVSDLSQYEGANVQLMLYSYNGTPRGIIVYPY